MGLTARIKRRDGVPLGTVGEVQELLASAFPGLVLRRSLSGPEKLQNLVAENLNIPEAIREHLLETPAVYEGDYQGANFSVEFHMSISEPVLDVGVEVRGTTTASDPLFELLEKRYGWITTLA